MSTYNQPSHSYQSVWDKDKLGFACKGRLVCPCTWTPCSSSKIREVHKIISSHKHTHALCPQLQSLTQISFPCKFSERLHEEDLMTPWKGTPKAIPIFNSPWLEPSPPTFKAGNVVGCKTSTSQSSRFSPDQGSDWSTFQQTHTQNLWLKNGWYNYSRRRFFFPYCMLILKIVSNVKM